MALRASFACFENWFERLFSVLITTEWIDFVVSQESDRLDQLMLVLIH